LILLFKRLLGVAAIFVLLWLLVAPPYGLRLSPGEIAVAIIVVTAISSWVMGIQMRRKIRRDLGRKPTEADLSSLDTWMKVDEVEQEKQRNNPSDSK